MEYWAVEVKAGELFKVELHGKRALHLSQACIGEVEKGSSESICLFVNVKGKKLVLGTLNPDKFPQQTFDLVFDKTFELSHNWKNGSVFFHGYTADNDISDETLIGNDSDSVSFEESLSSGSDEDIPVIAPNGEPETEVKQEDLKVSTSKDSAAGKQKVQIVQPKKDSSSEDSDDSSDDDATSSDDDMKVSAGKDSAAGKQKLKVVEPKKGLSSDDNDDSSDDDATSSENDPKVTAGKGAAAGKLKAKVVEKTKDDVSSEDDDSGDDDDAMSEDDSEDDKDKKSAPDEDSDSDEDEVTPVQAKSSKKRTAVSASKKSVPEKKAKLITPPKTDGKKSVVHVDTPYPSKQAKKALANKPNQPTPKTEESHPCKSCKKTFKSEIGLESHTKAKHSGGK